MVAHAYSTPDDAYRVSGLGALAFVSRPRPIDPRAGDAFDPITGTFSLIGHGYTADDRVRLVLTGSGSLPAGATSTALHVLPVDYFSFQVATAAGGAALTFADRGAGWGVQIDPEPRLVRIAQDVASIIDECLTAHSTPILRDPVTLTYPTVLVGLSARMVARRYLPTMAGENPAIRSALDRLMASAAFDGDGGPVVPGSLLGDWKAGKTIAPQPTDQTAGPDDAAWANGRAPQASRPWVM